MQVIGNLACFAVEDPAPILEAILEAKSIVFKGQNVVAVPDQLEYLQVMHNLGYEVISPIQRYYGYPIRAGWTRGWWQSETAEFLTLNRRAHCHNAMRTRKTFSTLWAIDYLQTNGFMGKCLVIAPLSSMELAWADTLYFNFPRKKYAVLHCAADKRRKLLAQDCDIYIVNHEGVQIILDDLMKRTDIDAVVLDESHEYANSQTQKWKAANQFINKSGRVKWCWGLTGTPTPQGPTAAYGQMKLITPHNYSGSFTRFKMDTMLQVSQFKWVTRQGSEDIVKRALHPAIRFKRDVVTSMEPCLIERHAELSTEQRQHYTKLKKECLTEIRGTTVTAVNAAIMVMRLMQAATGCVYGPDGEFLEIDFGPRLRVVEELIEQNEEKVLVFVPFTGALEALARELRKRWTVEVVDGSVSPSKRDQIFRDFQTTAKPHVIVAHPGTMAYSLDLCAASLIIWYAPPAGGNKVYQQASARIDGGNQKVKMDIAHISGTPEERRAYDVVMGKGKWQDCLLAMVEDSR